MDLLDQNTIKLIIKDIESSQNKQRREREIKASEVYSGALKEHVEDRLKYIYPKTYKSFSKADLNLSRKITDKLSTAYNKSPARLLDNDKETEDYSMLMKGVDSARAWQTFDIYYNLHRYACMWFSFYEDRGELKIILRPLAPHQFSRVVDNKGRTKVFVVNFPDDELFDTDDTDGVNSVIQDSEQDTYSKKYAFWTDDQHVVVSIKDSEDPDDGKIVKYHEITGNIENKNELGMIPATFAQQGDLLALPIINPLTDQTIEFNQQYSVMLTGSSLQTFGHLILSHPADQPMPDEIQNSLFTYSRLPQTDGDIATTLDYINPSPNLDTQLQVLQNYGHQIISEHLGDGSQNVNGSDNFTSGLDRMIAQSDITNKIEANQQLYAKNEDELYRIIKAFYNALDKTMFMSESLQIIYPKAKPIESESEILSNIEKKMSLGLIEKHEALVMLDPNMTVEAAKQKIDKIKEESMTEIDTMFGDTEDANQQEEI